MILFIKLYFNLRNFIKIIMLCDIFSIFNSLMIFWPKKNSVVFLGNIISYGLYQIIRNNIVTKKTTELLLFHKNTTKLVLLWPNMSQKIMKVLK